MFGLSSLPHVSPGPDARGGLPAGGGHLGRVRGWAGALSEREVSLCGAALLWLDLLRAVPAFGASRQLPRLIGGRTLHYVEELAAALDAGRGAAVLADLVTFGGHRALLLFVAARENERDQCSRAEGADHVALHALRRTPAARRRKAGSAGPNGQNLAQWSELLNPSLHEGPPPQRTYRSPVRARPG